MLARTAKLTRLCISWKPHDFRARNFIRHQGLLNNILRQSQYFHHRSRRQGWVRADISLSKRHPVTHTPTGTRQRRAESKVTLFHSPTDGLAFLWVGRKHFKRTARGKAFAERCPESLTSCVKAHCCSCIPQGACMACHLRGCCSSPGRGRNQLAGCVG